MTQYYIGVKQIMAWPQTNEKGAEGYAVKYEDGYISWSPKDVFEKSYLPMGEDNDGSTITEEMVSNFIVSNETVGRVRNHTVVCTTLANNYIMINKSACADPANYDEKIGAAESIKKARNQVWSLLGFLLCSARNGFKQ